MSAIIPPFTGSGRISLTTQAGTAVGGDLFIPPPASTTPYTNAIAYMGRTTLNTPTTVTLPNSSSLGLLLFDGLAGHTITASFASVNGSSYAYQLLDPTNTLIGNGCNNSPCFEADRLRVSGTYTLAIFYGSTTVTLSDSTPITQTITPNGSALTLNLGLGQNGQLTFAASAGQQATVQFSNNSIPDVTVSLLSPDGAVVRTLRSTAASFSLPTAMLPQSGLHSILIHPMNASTGSVTVSLTLLGGTHPVPSRPAGTASDPSSSLYANLVGLFAMNEGSGTTDQNLVDGQTAALSGSSAPTWNTTDPSIVFNGGANLNSYLNAGTDLSFDQLPASKMTVVAKVYLNGLNAGAVGEKFYGGQGFYFYWDAYQTIYFGVDSNLYVATANQAMAAGRWIQLAATWDGTLGGAANLHIFVDGVEQTKAITVNQSGRQPYFSATNQPLSIGSSAFSSSLTGKMAYFAVYRGRMLSGAELAQLDSQLPLTSDVIGSITENGSGVTKTTTVAGQGVQLTFQGWYGQQVTVQLSNNSMGAVTVSLVNPDASILATASSSASSFNVPTATLPTNGQFDVVVRPTGATSGSITVRLSVQGGFRTQGLVLDPSNAYTTNLAGLFLMNEGIGTTDKNLVDNQTASFSGSSLPTWNTTDPSVVFNGGYSLNSYLNAGTDLIFDQLTPGKMTLVAKVYVTDPSPAAGVVEKNDGNSVNSGFEFGWDANGALNLTVEKSAVDMSVSTGKGSIPYGQWIQVAATWDGTVGNASAAHLFVNGAEQSKASSTDGSGTIGYSNATNQPLRIGNASFAPIAGSLSGKMAYLAVYRGRVLTATELNQLDAQLPVTQDVVTQITVDAPPVSATTTISGQNAQFTFNASAGKTVTVQLSNNTMGAVTVSLLAPDKTTLTSLSSSASSFSLNAVTTPAAGLYDVVVHPTGGTTGSISAAVTVQDPQRPSGAVLDTSNPLSNNLVGLFIMNEGTGTTDKNLVDNQTASFSGTSLPTWNTGDPSIVFNGGSSLNSYLNAGTDSNFDQMPNNKITILAKVYVTTLAAGGVAEKNDGNSIDSGFVFGWDGSGALRLTVEKSAADMRVATATGAVTTGQWMQVAFTWDGTVGTAAAAHLYVNGSEQTKASSADGGGTIGYSNATNQPFRIGNASFDSQAGSLNGRMEYLAVYKGRILTTTEMNQFDSQLPIH